MRNTETTTVMTERWDVDNNKWVNESRTTTTRLIEQENTVPSRATWEERGPH